MAHALLSPDGLHHALARMAVQRADNAARDVDYAPGSPEMAALVRAEAIWAEMEHAA